MFAAEALSLRSKHKAQLDAPLDGVSYTVEFEVRHFSKGSCRLAFQGAYRGNGAKNERKCVVKTSVADGWRWEVDFAQDLRASQVAHSLAKYFNEEYVSSKPIRFVLPALATVLSIGQPNRFINVGDKILVEDFIEGHYEKFNNNTSYHSDEVATVPCFSHYTYYKTGGRYLVCDIQGVRTPSGYVLTDPAVHSLSQGQYGCTDLGLPGMTRFFSGHRCTSICVLFPISNTETGRDLFNMSANVSGKNYCGGQLNGAVCDCCNGYCGPSNGCNCANCMLRDIEQFGLTGGRALVNREGAVARLSGVTRKFYCGRRNMLADAMTNGFCGSTEGNNCHACRQLDTQSCDRYASIVDRWQPTGKQPVVPSSVVYRR